MFKKIIAGLAIGCASQLALASSPTLLTTANDVKTALMGGADVTVTLDFSQCTNTDPAAPVGTTRGGLKIDAFRIVADGTISFSDQRQTIDRNGLPILQVLRYQVKPDGNIAFTTNMFALPSYTPAPVVGYTCAVNRGAYFYENGGHYKTR